MNKKYDNNMKVSLWEKVGKNGNPFYSGTLEIDGDVYNVTLFHNEVKNEKSPILTGKIEVPKK